MPRSRDAALLLPLALAAVVFCAAAQAPGTSAAASVEPASAATREFPAPTNLKVLPKNLTGQQVQDIMEQWKTSLGIQCDGCHAEVREKAESDETPRLNFADDSKPMKAIARLMYTMTDRINTNYIAKVEGSGVPVACGTCHRGHIGPEPFSGTTVEPVLKSDVPPANDPAQPQ